MGKLRQQAEQRASELLKTSDVKLNREAGTYQLINKASKQTENLPLSGIDVGSGMFAKNRRMNRLIGKSLTRDSEMSTVGEIPAQVQQSTPAPKQPEAKAATGEVKPTVNQPVEQWNSPAVQNRFSLGSPSTLVPRRLTFTPGEQFRMGFGSTQQAEPETKQTSGTGPVAYNGVGSLSYGENTPEFTGAGSLNYKGTKGIEYPKSSTLVPKSSTTPTSSFDAASTVAPKDLEHYKASMIAASRAHGYNKQEEDRISGLSATSPEVIKAITGGKKTKTIVGLINPYREHTPETEQYNPYSPSFKKLSISK